MQIARDELRRVRELTRSIDALKRELAALVAELAPRLLAEPGAEHGPRAVGGLE